jgi:hypothetical protein
MSVEGGIEQIEAVEFAEEDCIEDVVDGQRIVGVLTLNLFEAGDGSVVVENVEPVESLAHRGVQVERVGINSRGRGDCGPSDLWKKHQQGN